MVRQTISGLVGAFAVLALAAACSPHPSTYHSATKLARDIGCDGFVMDPPPAGGRTETGSCMLGTSQVHITIFTTDEARDSWRRVTSTGNYVAGTSYSIGVEKDLIDSVADKIDAPIRSKDPSAGAPGRAD